MENLGHTHAGSGQFVKPLRLATNAVIARVGFYKKSMVLTLSYIKASFPIFGLRVELGDFLIEYLAEFFFELLNNTSKILLSY
jgi:hypothetical protein